jgi:hypothetical protein
MIFYSKRSIWLGLIIFLPLLSVTLDALVNKSLEALILPLVFLALVTWLWFGTRYIIKDGVLKVWAGFIPYPHVPIAKIERIKPTKSMLAAPACSLDRILVQYGSSDYIIVSPKDKQAFIKALRVINSDFTLSNELK